MSGPRRGNARAHQLQPKRFIGCVGDGRLLHDAICSGAYDKAVGHVVLQRRHNRGAAKVHGNGSVKAIANLCIARDVALRNGRLYHGHLLILL